MIVERVVDATPEVVEALQRLIPQLGISAAPSATAVELVVASAANILLVARDDGGRIQGTLTMVIHRKLAGDVAWIEDVVVDHSARRRGYAEALLGEAARLAGDRGIRGMRLTSRAFRKGAHRLYEKQGFRQHKTRVYRLDLGEP